MLWRNAAARMGGTPRKVALMPQSQQKVQKLMKQYPFLREVRHWTSKIDEELSQLEEFSVFVERADPDLMFRAMAITLVTRPNPIGAAADTSASTR